MTTTTRKQVPLGLFTALGVAGFTGVLASGGHGWQLVASAGLSLVLVGLDVNAWRRRR
jgi:hypothetical protein